MLLISNYQLSFFCYVEYWLIENDWENTAHVTSCTWCMMSCSEWHKTKENHCLLVLHTNLRNSTTLQASPTIFFHANLGPKWQVTAPTPLNCPWSLWGWNVFKSRVKWVIVQFGWMPIVTEVKKKTPKDIKFGASRWVCGVIIVIMRLKWLIGQTVHGHKGLYIHSHYEVEMT